MGMVTTNALKDIVYYDNQVVIEDGNLILQGFNSKFKIGRLSNYFVVQYLNWFVWYT